MIAIVDGDIIVYQIAFGAQNALYHIGGLITPKRSVAEKYRKDNKIEEEVRSNVSVKSESIVRANIDNFMSSMFKAIGTTEYKMYLTGSDPKRPNFRDAIAKTVKYKENRKGSPKPLYYAKLREWLEEDYAAEVVYHMEADDAMGIAHYGVYKDDPEGSIMCTLDKDLDNVPGLHYNWRKNKIYTVQPFEAILNLYTQMLVGDRADNIPGIKGLGPVKAEKLLKECKTEEELVNVVEKCYNNHYDSDALSIMEETKTLLKILIDKGDVK